MFFLSLFCCIAITFDNFAIFLLLCNKFQDLIKKCKVMIEGCLEWDS